MTCGSYCRLNARSHTKLSLLHGRPSTTRASPSFDLSLAPRVPAVTIVMENLRRFPPECSILSALPSNPCEQRVARQCV